MPEVRLADLVEDATNALIKVAEMFPNTKVLAIGHSAGAHLAHWALEQAELPRGRIAGYVGISGIYDRWGRRGSRPRAP